METNDYVDEALRALINAELAPETSEHLPVPDSGLCDVTLLGTMIREYGREGTVIDLDLWGGSFATPDGFVDVEEMNIRFDCAVGGPAHADAITEARELAEIIGLLHSKQASFDLYSQPGKVSMFTDGKWTLALPRIGGGQ